jgi:hypothetical protein
VRKACQRYFLIILILWGAALSIAHSQPLPEQQPYISSPTSTLFGILFTDNYRSGLYLSSGSTVRTIVNSVGCGNNYTLSNDRSLVGYKSIAENGLQAPSVVELATGESRMLHQPVQRAGQVSFTENGKFAFSIGDSLIVVDGTSRKVFDLGNYANLTPISPDGKFVAFNDKDDQIWILDLVNHVRSRVSDKTLGYFSPMWDGKAERLLYSSLSGILKVYELASQSTFLIGEGFAPSWSSDSRSIVFYRKEIRNDILVNTDLFIASYDGSAVTQVTATPDVFEMDPQFINNDAELLYHTYDRHTISRSPLVRDQNKMFKSVGQFRKNLVDYAPTPNFPRTDNKLRKSSSIVSLDIPYVHQCYDTPDWHNGNGSCAPTAALMVLAYYGILPPWQTSCSTPTQHSNDWGNYVAGKYYFRGVDYSAYQTTDYGNKVTWGAYGYMWKTGSPNSRMAGFYTSNGMSASQTWSTAHSVAVDEVTAGRPFSMCVMLTTAGHLIVAHGFGAEQHTFVFNDPYGNKNIGYMNYQGKNVQYDWPGYNNGFQNLTGVAWCIATQYSPVAPADTLVDDLQFGKGFYLHAKAPASMSLWKDTNTGYGSHAWTSSSTDTDTCYAVWTPNITKSASYEVFAFIPGGSNALARYAVSGKNGQKVVEVDQQSNQNSWVSLGTYEFDAGTAATNVRLGTGSAVRGATMGFDAVQWNYRAPAIIPTRFALGQNYPNPFNPNTTIRFDLPAPRHVTLKVFDLLGREVATLLDEQRREGEHTVRFDASRLTSGMYTYRLQAGANSVAIKKMLLLR